MKRWLLAFVLIPGMALAADPIKPDPNLTPGEANNPPTALATLCTPGYAKTVRHVSDAMKNDVFRRYGYDPKTVVKHDYEIDHLISLELDGKNTVANLWPESMVAPPPNAHTKDVLENTLHRLVCHGTIPLAEAQHMIATDWIAAYQTYVLHHVN